MKAIFLESKAAEQCLAYAKGHAWDEATTQDLLDRCYANSSSIPNRRGQSVEDWWVRKCLNEDHHKGLRLIALFNWGRSDEGHRYWQRIHEWRQ